MVVGYKWVFIRKQNKNNEIVQYNARLVAQDFSQRPDIDYEKNYSLVMNAITLRFFYWFSSLTNSKYTFNRCSNNISIYR